LRFIEAADQFQQLFILGLPRTAKDCQAIPAKPHSNANLDDIAHELQITTIYAKRTIKPGSTCSNLLLYAQNPLHIAAALPERY
jgi:hypothetical protein